MQKQTDASFLVKFLLSRLEHLRHRILRRRRHCVRCALPLLTTLAFCAMAFAWAVLLPSLLSISGGPASIRKSADWRTQGVIATASRRGDLIIRPALLPGAGLCDQMFSWASVRTLADRLAEHLPANRSLFVVVPSNSKLFGVFGQQVSSYLRTLFLKTIRCVLYLTQQF